MTIFLKRMLIVLMFIFIVPFLIVAGVCISIIFFYIGLKWCSLVYSIIDKHMEPSVEISIYDSIPAVDDYLESN